MHQSKDKRRASSDWRTLGYLARRADRATEACGTRVRSCSERFLLWCRHSLRSHLLGVSIWRFVLRRSGSRATSLYPPRDGVIQASLSRLRCSFGRRREGGGLEWVGGLTDRFTVLRYACLGWATAGGDS